MKKTTALLLVTASSLSTQMPLVMAQATPEYVGSFVVSDGPEWTTNPPVYTGQEAAALLFGGDPADYAISTNPDTTDSSTITNTAWYDGWGSPCTEFAEDYSVDLDPAGYEFPSEGGASWSAYVSDHGCSQVNYVWRISSIVNSEPVAVPLGGPAMLFLLAALLTGGGCWRLRRSNA